MQITYAMLVKKGACADQRDLFAKLFPNGTPKTKRAAMAAARRHADKFDWNWAAMSFLSAPAWKAYKEAATTAWEAYKEAATTAWEAYDEATAPAWKAYKEAATPAWEAYKEATANAFVDALFIKGTM